MAHPVAFQSAWQWMLGGTPSMQNMELHYSYCNRAAVGIHAMHFEDDLDDTFFGVQHNWLLKRWNLSDAQANIYLGAAAGAARRENQSWSPAALTYVRADYETREIFTAFDSKWIASEDVSRAVTSVSLGFAPYKAEFEQLNSWLILQLEHISGMDDDFAVIPKLRFFKANYFFEIGYSLDGDPLVNVMIHF